VAHASKQKEFASASHETAPAEVLQFDFEVLWIVEDLHYPELPAVNFR
jgi:hypothetical protein